MEILSTLTERDFVRRIIRTKCKIDNNIAESPKMIKTGQTSGSVLVCLLH